MKEKSKQTQNLERGITLISLVVTIVILVILAALILRAVTGDESLIGVTTEATENYKIEQYREDLMRVTMGTIQSCMIKGEDVTLEKIASSIRQDLDWVAAVKVNEDETITNPDIIVTSKEGYVFQVTYDDIYGSFKIDYIGKNPGGTTGGGSGEEGIDEMLKYIPRVTGKYDKVNTQIIGEAEVSKGSIKTLEIIFQGKTLAPDAGSNTAKLVKTIDEVGIYQIKATTDKGISRTAYVRVNSLSRRSRTTRNKRNKRNTWNRADGIEMG